MDVTLDTLGEVIIDDLPDTLEVHSSRHDLSRNHNPTFASPHTAHRVFPLLFRHTGMQVIYIPRAAKHKFLGQ